MHKLKHKIDKDFTVTPNSIYRDNRLSFKAKGLWLTLISLPDGWSFSVSGLSKLAKENERAVKSAIDELVEYGYLKWCKMRDESGAFTVVATTLLPDISPYGKTSTGQNATWQNADNIISNNKELKTNKESNNTSSEVEKELLKIINQVIGREFRTLPRGYKKTLELFSLEEIKKSLTNMSADAWHSQRLKTLSSDYLLRATTIDKFLASKPPDKFVMVGGVAKKKEPDIEYNEEGRKKYLEMRKKVVLGGND